MDMFKLKELKAGQQDLENEIRRQALLSEERHAVLMQKFQEASSERAMAAERLRQTFMSVFSLGTLTEPNLSSDIPGFSVDSAGLPFV